ncbi:MAG: VOC family protein [bacterium]
MVTKGTTPIQAPATMPWGQKTAFFADPDGNIHELFANLPDEEKGHVA